MPVHNADIAAIFNEIADLLEIEGENQFRIRAYRNAARTLDMLAPSVQAMVEEGKDLKELPGIGADLSARITEIVTTGTCGLRDQLRHELLPSIDELLRIPGVGPKRARLLYQERGIHTPHQLLDAARKGQLRTIPGLGAGTEQRILEAVESRLSKERRFSIAVAAQVVEPLLKYLKRIKETENIEAAGSYRRMKETVGDLDIVACSAHTERLTQHLYGGRYRKIRVRCGRHALDSTRTAGELRRNRGCPERPLAAARRSSGSEGRLARSHQRIGWSQQ